MLSDTGYILRAGDDTRVTLGAFLEILLMIGPLIFLVKGFRPSPVLAGA